MEIDLNQLKSDIADAEVETVDLQELMELFRQEKIAFLDSLTVSEISLYLKNTESKLEMSDY